MSLVCSTMLIEVLVFDSLHISNAALRFTPRHGNQCKYAWPGAVRSQPLQGKDGQDVEAVKGVKCSL